MSRLTQLGPIAAIAVALTVLSAAAPDVAEAQTASTECASPEGNCVDADFKGAVGLGLVGAELGFIIPALAGLHETWAFILFPILGGAGGAVGGYFAFDNSGETELSVAALAFGMAMIIPTMVITLSLTAYDPGDEGEEASGGAEFEEEFGSDVEVEEGNPDAEQVDETASSSAARQRRLAQLARSGPGLVRLSDGDLSLSVPGIGFRPAAEAGGDTSVHLAVFSGSF